MKWIDEDGVPLCVSKSFILRIIEKIKYVFVKGFIAKKTTFKMKKKNKKQTFRFVSVLIKLDQV